MWSEKYRNYKIESFFGNEKSRIVVYNWLKKWVKGTKPLLILGPPGTGKTSYAISVARTLDYDIIELNASDVRNKASMQEIMNPISNNEGIFGNKVLLLLDEIDGISAREDFGGISYLNSILRNFTIPIVMIANSKNSKIRELQKYSKTVDFIRLNSFSSLLLIESILIKEHKKLDLEEKIDLIKKSKGDARSLINLLQLKLEGYTTQSEPVLSSYSIEECINNFFSANDISEAKMILSNSEIRYSSPRYGYSQEERNKDLLNAIFTTIISNEKKIPSKVKSDILDKLSKIDLFINSIFKNRDWHLLKYANDLFLFELFTNTRNLDIKYNQYSVPFPLIGSIFIRGQSLKSLRNILATSFHTSTSQIGLFYYSYLIMIVKMQAISDINFESNDFQSFNEIISKEKEKLIN